MGDVGSCLCAGVGREGAFAEQARPSVAWRGLDVGGLSIGLVSCRGL